MIKWDKARVIRLAKRVGLVYLGLVLGGSLLYLDSRAWMKPLKEVNRYQADMDKLEKAQQADGSLLDRCLSLRDGEVWGAAARQCLSESEQQVSTGYGRALLAGYLSDAGGDRQQRIRLLTRAFEDIRRERDQPWNKLLREARSACDRTVLPCLAQDLHSTPEHYDRTLATLASELARLYAEGL